MKRAVHHLKNIEAIRFLAAGAVGFSVNFTVLAVLHVMLGWPLLLSQLIGLEAGCLVSFSLHHVFTYSEYSPIRIHNRLLRFHASSWMGGLITTTGLLLLVHFAQIPDLLALPMAALMGLAWNYTMNKHFVWSKHRLPRSRQVSGHNQLYY